jgi:hypothetical protein
MARSPAGGSTTGSQHRHLTEVSADDSLLTYKGCAGSDSASLHSENVHRLVLYAPQLQRPYEPWPRQFQSFSGPSSRRSDLSDNLLSLARHFVTLLSGATAALAFAARAE